MITPLVLGVFYALFYSIGLIGLLSNGLTFDHWVSVFKDQNTYQSLIFSLYVAFVSTLLASGFSISILWMTKYKKNKFSLWWFLPLCIPQIVAGFFSFLALGNTGFLSRLSFHLNFINNSEEFPTLIFDPYGIGIILTHTLLLIPLFTLLFINIYENESLDQLIQLAKSYGAKSTDILRKVVIPIVLHRAKPVIIIYFIFTIGSYEIPLILGTQKHQMFSIFILEKLKKFSLATIPTGYAMSLLYTFLVLIFAYIFLRKKSSIQNA